MPLVECIDCGEEFWREPDESWKVRCLDCWKDHKAGQGGLKARLEELEGEVIRLERENVLLHQRLTELKDRLRFLLFAVHPDRNPGHVEQATETTQWLLTVKENIHQWH